jgi:hypothetical protein
MHIAHRGTYAAKHRRWYSSSASSSASLQRQPPRTMNQRQLWYSTMHRSSRRNSGVEGLTLPLVMAAGARPAACLSHLRNSSSVSRHQA